MFNVASIAMVGVLEEMDDRPLPAGSRAALPIERGKIVEFPEGRIAPNVSCCCSRGGSCSDNVGGEFVRPRHAPTTTRPAGRNCNGAVGECIRVRIPIFPDQVAEISGMADITQAFTTIISPTRAELKVRGSRFIGTAVPVRTREEVADELTRLKKEFWDATHNCYAYRLAPDGLQYRFSDDGEPSGSAGKPILFVLQQRNLVNTLVVVTRYFGGTKLGVGGLVRAYTEGAQAALDLAQTLVEYPTSTIRVFTPYEDMKAVRPIVERYALRFEEEFRDVVSYMVVLRLDHLDEFSALLTDISQGRAGMVRLDPVEVP